MRVVVTTTAKRDLAAIGANIGKDNPDRAASFMGEILDRCEGLADFPRRYPLVPRYEHFGIRRCLHENYLVFYRVGSETIEVVHILHGAQDYESLLFPSR